MAIALPDNPTPEQFKKAEPILLKSIIESVYTDGIDDINYRMVKPGHYEGEFKDEDRRFKFVLQDDSINYKPINPDAIAD